ncbi:MAG TPA: Gfo/Idh/MocA family oxidoreductase [Candidatus Nanoarchaeia archaeon]|nr:Gfo/Idh/MocA family oxidoreductase [Candidatus Nanoarchaeia archaeon]
MKDKVVLAVVGLGYWGPNLVRNAYLNHEVRLKTICDINPAKFDNIKTFYNSVVFTQNLEDVYNDAEIDAVLIATPPHIHHSVAKKCLEHGKHVLIEKPFTGKCDEALDLIKLAEQKNLIVFAGHTFLYTGAVEKMKELIDSGEVGDILHIHSSRLNLGRFQNGNTNVVLDLMPHDISMILHILNNKMPKKIIASAQSHFTPRVEDTANATLVFDGNISAHLQVSWINPWKVRTFTVIGTKKMIVFDDTETTEKIKVYDMGVASSYSNYGEFLASYRYGDTFIPKIKSHEALWAEINHFVECIKNGKKPLTDGKNGYNVVKVVNDIQKAINLERAWSPE